MNKYLYELTGLTEPEIKEWFKAHKMKFKNKDHKRKFFEDIQKGIIIKNEKGELIYANK